MHAHKLQATQRLERRVRASDDGYEGDRHGDHDRHRWSGRLRRHRVDQARVASSRPRSARGHVQRVGGHARGRGIPRLHRCHRSRLRHARRPSARRVRPRVPGRAAHRGAQDGAATRRARRDGGRPVGRLPAEGPRRLRALVRHASHGDRPAATRRLRPARAIPRRSRARRGRPCGGRGRARGLRGLLSHGHVARGGTRRPRRSTCPSSGRRPCRWC